MKHPTAWLPVAMSLAVLVMVVTVLGVSGATRQADEGTPAHIFQLWLVVEALAVVAFAALWLPERRRAAIVVLAVQIACAVAACAPVFYFHL